VPPIAALSLARPPPHRQNAGMVAPSRRALSRKALSRKELAWASLSTPVGQVSVGCSTDGVALVRYGAPDQTGDSDQTSPDQATPDRASPDRASPDQTSRDLADRALAELTEYFRGDRTAFDLPIDWSGTAGPQREVLKVLADSVGYGKTISYGTLADRAGLAPDDGLTPGGDIPARLVGQIMGSNPIPVIVPCHRVLASDGLGGYSGGAGVEVKRWLLILEGSLPPTLDWQPMDLA
jgi:methylated-DNA-[protein]-cysteine S-methyltransferase